MRRAALVLALLALTVSAANAQVELKPRLLEGKSTARQNVRFQQMLTLAGMDIPTKADVTMTMTTGIGPRAADGTVRMAQTMDRMQVKLDLPGGVNLEFDTEKPTPTSPLAELQPMVEAWAAMKGATYTIVLDADNKVKAVEGLDKIGAGLSPAAQEALKGDLSAESIRRETTESLTLFPTTPVKVGDRWQRTQVLNIGNGQTLTFENYYEYQGTVQKDGKTLDKISVFAGAVTYAMTPGAGSPLTVTRSALTIDGSTGTLLFDRERGQVVESTTSSRIVGPMTFSINGMDLEGKLELAMEMATTPVK
jgi:hypothetical protein